MNPLSVLRDSLYFFRRHLTSILQLCLPLVVLEALGTQLLYSQLGEQASPVYGMLVSLLFYPLYSAALILYLDTRSNGQDIAKRDLFARALQLWPMLALLVVISSLLIMAGLALFIFPGVWIMVNLVFAEYLLVLRGLPVIESMRTSARMTTGHFLRIMVCMLSVLAPLWLIDGLLLTLFPEPQPGVQLALDSLSGFLQLFSTVVLYRLFMLLDSEASA
ncbi:MULTISPECIES: YciC family protein [unclassified Pseudomonas]|uniref:YciC family protein n=1 Tax=unclassified Pseudomonas TaxID=196821 RepID=UPI0024494BA8|nr:MULTISPECIES: YciC family protein [unclassified Pseudomonas]MDH0302398.1 YciC family protein [Pseudomonas sp. GD04091]MDH1984840.1 YciC family protein [Pseudomonas sp. GD03689]